MFVKLKKLLLNAYSFRKVFFENVCSKLVSEKKIETFWGKIYFQNFWGETFFHPQ